MKIKDILNEASVTDPNDPNRVVIADPRVKSGTTVDPTAPKVSVDKSALIQRTEKEKRRAANTAKNPNKDRLSGYFKDPKTGQIKSEKGSYTSYGTKGQPGHKEVRTGPDRKGLADQRRDKEAAGTQTRRPVMHRSKAAVADLDRELEDTELRRGAKVQVVDQIRADAYVKKGDPRDKRLEVSVERDKDGKKVRKEVWQSDLDAKKIEDDKSQKKWEEKYGNYGTNLSKKRVLQDYVKNNPGDKKLQAKLDAHLKDMDRTKIDTGRQAMELYRATDKPLIKNSFLADPYSGIPASKLARNPEYAKELYQFAKETGNTKQMDRLAELGYSD